MIIKSYEINKIDFNRVNIILLHGQNQGAKEEIISKILSEKNQFLSKYDEKEVLENLEIFYNNCTSRSLFESEKIIVINRSTDKIYKVIEQIENSNLSGILLIIEASNLDKKSKLRSFFEKSKKSSFSDVDPCMSSLSLVSIQPRTSLPLSRELSFKAGLG